MCEVRAKKADGYCEATCGICNPMRFPTPTPQYTSVDLTSKTTKDSARTVPVLLFLHIYKTGGTSSRQLFADWAQRKALRFAQVGSCPEGAWMTELQEDNAEYICLSSGHALDDIPTPRPAQMSIVSQELDVMAGHMAWGFHNFIPKANTRYVTCLRNPMARYVSGILYANRNTHHTGKMNLEQVVAFVEENIFNCQGAPYRGIYAAKLSGRMREAAGSNVQTEQQEEQAVSMAISHLQNSVAVVGQIEHYPVFVELVAALLDPGRSQDELWTSAAAYHSNRHYGFDEIDAIPKLSLNATRTLNASLQLDWKVYLAGCRVTYEQCRAVVLKKTAQLHDDDCTAVRETCGF